jgi:hypothetical protein
VVRTETRLDGVVKRRSLCAKCGHLWTTWDGSLTPPPVTRGRTSPYTEQVLQYLEAGAQQTRIALGLQIPIHVVRHIARKHKHERP